MQSKQPKLPIQRSWVHDLSGYHWYVLTIAALGWLFDTMDQQLFVLARTPALKSLLGPDADVPFYSGVATTVFIVGWATGGLVFGLIGDKLGRARTMIWTILLYSIFTGLSAVSVTWWDFTLYRFMTGMGVGGEFAAGVALVAEVMPQRARPFALGLLQALSALGNMAAAGISLLLPPQLEIQGVSGWRWMFLVGIVPAILVIFIRRGLREPEAWVQAKMAAEQGEREDLMHQKLGDIAELFGTPRWLGRALIGITLSSAGVMALWGVGFFTPELVRGNVFGHLTEDVQDYWASITSLLQNLGAFFGIYAFSLLAARVGRRPAFAVSFLASFAAIVMVFGFMKEQNQILWMIPILGFCTLMPFGGYAIYFPELFPTRLRSTGIGLCYNVARYLAAGAPMVLGMLTVAFTSKQSDRSDARLADFSWLSQLGGADDAFRYAAITVALVTFIGVLILPFAPETKDRPLPE